MNDRQRFNAVMSYAPFDRLPIYFFGAWDETYKRWRQEGLNDVADVARVTGMDEDWETGMWGSHNLVNTEPFPPGPDRILEETGTYKIVQDGFGGITKYGKAGSTIPHHIEHCLKPTRESWNVFKAALNPNDPERRLVGWKERADQLNKRERVATFMAGSLYGWARNWMGTEAISYLAYDDPILYEDIIEYMAEFFMAMYGPVLERVQFDFAYFFEDCCFNTGPLISPPIYEKYYRKYYVKMINFYRSRGVPFMMIDSDGKIDVPLPAWLNTGFDIIFPIEVGTWRAEPKAFRQQFGMRMRMFGGVDKHVIPMGQEAIRAHLLPLRDVAANGGYIPIPDHRIPPDCSLENFKTYVRVFSEVFADIGTLKT
jgi:uroporphyrinogen decarboxylase